MASLAVSAPWRRALMAWTALFTTELLALCRSWVLRGWLIALALAEFFMLTRALLRAPGDVYKRQFQLIVTRHNSAANWLSSFIFATSEYVGHVTGDVQHLNRLRHNGTGGRDRFTACGANAA